MRPLGERVDDRGDPLAIDIASYTARRNACALLLGRELAVREQVRDLEEMLLLRELLDRVAAVAEDPGVAVDVRDRAARGRRREQRLVVRKDALLLQLGAVERAVLVDLDFDRLLRHVYTACSERALGPT